MGYLFGFKGRINRAKIWLFILVTIGWEIVVGLVAVFGLRWTNYLHSVQAMTDSSKAWNAPVGAPMPWPDPISGTGWVAAGVILLLVVLYFISLLAVYTKRLHDRNKSAGWLVPFVAVPWILNIFVMTTGPGPFPMGLWMGQLGTARGVAYLVACVVVLWAFIELFCLRGTNGENRFGPDRLG